MNVQSASLDALSQVEPIRANWRRPRWTDGPSWLFLAVLFYAPWAYGSTRPKTIATLNVLLGICVVGWAVGCLLERRRPAVPLWLLAPVTYLICQGWWMTLNAPFEYLPPLSQFLPRKPLLGGGPGSVDFARSLPETVRATLLLGALLMVADRAVQPRWRRKLLCAMCLAGLSIVVFGLIQKGAGAPSIFWEERDTGKTFFATYRYHSNAGAFINLVWQLLAGGLILSIRHQRPMRERLAIAAALTLCLCALAVTGARAAGGLGLLFAIFWCAWIARQIQRRRLPPVNLPTAVVGCLLGLALVGAAAALAGLEVSLQRWNKTDELFALDNPRLLVDQVCLRMIPEAGWFGFGPGTFRTTFPFFTHYLGDKISGIWLYAHQDYLQTIVEWGFLGAVAWTVCILGALVKVFRHRSSSLSERILNFSIAAAISITLLHALVDFPLQIASIQLYFLTLLGLLWNRPAAPAAPALTGSRVVANHKVLGGP